MAWIIPYVTGLTMGVWGFARYLRLISTVRFLPGVGQPYFVLGSMNLVLGQQLTTGPYIIKYPFTILQLSRVWCGYSKYCSKENQKRQSTSSLRKMTRLRRC